MMIAFAVLDHWVDVIFQQSEYVAFCFPNLLVLRLHAMIHLMMIAFVVSDHWVDVMFQQIEYVSFYLMMHMVFEYVAVVVLETLAHQIQFLDLRSLTTCLAMMDVGLDHVLD